MGKLLASGWKIKGRVQAGYLSNVAAYH